MSSRNLIITVSEGSGKVLSDQLARTLQTQLTATFGPFLFWRGAGVGELYEFFSRDLNEETRADSVAKFYLWQAARAVIYGRIKRSMLQQSGMNHLIFDSPLTYFARELPGLTLEKDEFWLHDNRVTHGIKPDLLVTLFETVKTGQYEDSNNRLRPGGVHYNINDLLLACSDEGLARQICQITTTHLSPPLPVTK